MSDSFATLPLPVEQLDNLQQLGYQHMTAIQQQALPAVLAGQDVLAQAKTGSGKTATFALGILAQLNPRFFGAQGLVLCPTRELATQVADEIRKLARYMANIKVVLLCGGQAIGPQIGSLSHGAHIIVGTPGRVCDHLRKGTLAIEQLKTLVLDEADRMLDMGFSEDMHFIAAHTPEQRQTLLFSATYPDNIELLSRDFQQQPTIVRITSQHSVATISQLNIRCDKHQRLEALQRTLAHHPVRQAVIFCNTRQTTMEVAQYLQELRTSAVALHGDLEQKDRDRLLTRFKHHSVNFLVATDVAARGLDVDDLDTVINFDLPRDPEVYVHRIGRTGRAGKQGQAFNIVSNNEQHLLDRIRQHTGHAPDDEVLEQLSTAALDIDLPPYVTLNLAAGRKDKLRPGDILGALTKDGSVPGSAVGKIDVLDWTAYVAIEREHAKTALKQLQENRIKGRRIKVRKA
ncbi:ATP-dependent RNA helicase [Bacterioplanes sanyensis]|uniref:ATP-dependent RNA helicase DbpA n=1 Tax=Bacterioplanes sanyensis TaxID=1249553 RepID=UPI00167B97D9|nr:ATP-dependent RNA helicase DbpA [Bacterioplanes sanyensis]GGY47763.1 ATP-dependent RNA helicase [Bacterioplanes sanyensis]